MATVAEASLPEIAPLRDALRAEAAGQIVLEPFRRRGLGSYLVQELKRAARELGAIPAARTNSDKFASQRTPAKAGMISVGKS